MRIFSTTRRKITAGIVTAGLALVLIPALHGAADWGPVRTTFTWANPASYITFNSITDNPQVGDERKFYGVADVNSTQYTKAINVSDNEEVSLRVYYHNNAASNLNLVATNSRVRFALPSTASTSTWSTAHISADNATPGDVADTVDFTGALPFTLSYEPGTAQIWNNVLRGTQLSDSIVTSSGALIGYSQIDGRIPGCSQYSGYVTIKVRVRMQAPQANFACSGLDVAEVDRTHFNFTALATATNANVTSYSFVAKDGNGNVVDTKNVSTSALSAQYAFNQSNPGTYTVSVVVNTDHGSTNAGDCSKQITVQKETPKPVFACNALNVTTGANRAITASVDYQADNGAKLQSVNYSFGDGATLMTDKTSVDHTYAKDGTYTVSATLSFNVGDTTKTASCSHQVTITTPVTPQVLSTTTTLPNTGPGDDVAGLFAGATALGAAGHYAVAFRRNKRG